MKKFFSSWHLGVALVSTGLLGFSHPAMAALPTLAVNDISVNEGNSGTLTATFLVSLSAPSTTPVTVKYATADGTANAPDDYTALPLSTLTFNAGQTSRAVNVTVKGDVIDEVDEGFSLKLSAPTGATLADGTGVCSIKDNDISTITATGATVTEGNSGTTPLNFTIKLSTPNSRTVTVKAKTIDAPTSPATVNNDYVGLASTTVSFAPGETTKVIPVSVKGDVLDDANNEFVGLSLITPVNAVIGTVGVGTIVDDDPIPAISVADTSVTEGNSGLVNAVFKVTLSSGSNNPITVKYATANTTTPSGRNAQSNDYVAIPLSTLTFAPGQTVKAINVAVNGDQVDEDDETFALKLSASTNATIADNLAIGTIINDEKAIFNISIAQPNVNEGNSGKTPMTFTITRSIRSDISASVTVSVAGVGSFPARYGFDYTLGQSTLVYFGTGLSETFTVDVVGDTRDEYDRKLSVTLTDPDNGVLGPNRIAQGTIVDDDDPPVLSLGNTSVVQDYDGDQVTSVGLHFSNLSEKTITFKYRTVDGSATAPSDYTTVPLTMGTFDPSPDGEHDETIYIVIKRESSTSPDPDENFRVELSSPTNATVNNVGGIVTILDHHNLPPEAHDVFIDLGSHPQRYVPQFSVGIAELGTDPDGDPLTVSDLDVGDDWDAYDTYSAGPDGVSYTGKSTVVVGNYYIDLPFKISDGQAIGGATIHVTYSITQVPTGAPSQPLTGPSGKSF